MEREVIQLTESEEKLIRTIRSIQYGKVSASLVRGEITLVEKTQTFLYNKPTKETVETAQ